MANMKSDLLSLIRAEIVKVDGVNDEEYLKWKIIYDIVREYDEKKDLRMEGMG